MNRYFIRHIIKAGDITHLSDKDSLVIIERKTQKEEDYIELQSDQELFLGQITFIDKASVEVEAIKSLGKIVEDPENKVGSITIIQSVGNARRMNMIMEKLTEIGVDKIIPIVSDLSDVNLVEAKKQFTKWNQIIDAARIQSRNPHPPLLIKPLSLDEFKEKQKLLFTGTEKRICLSSEVISKGEFSKSVSKPGDYVVAVGPEKGWSPKDIEILKELHFTFVSIGENILRIETASIVTTSIIRFINGSF